MMVHMASSPLNCAFPWKDLDPNLTHGSAFQSESSTETGIWMGSAVFAGLTSVTVAKHTTVLVR